MKKSRDIRIVPCVADIDKRASVIDISTSCLEHTNLGKI